MIVGATSFTSVNACQPGTNEGSVNVHVRLRVTNAEQEE